MKTQYSVLLASATANGTIAAVRNLGSNGFDVRVVSSHLLSAAAWSCWPSAVFRAPAENESELFLERIRAIGRADPGRILLPTSDETAWLYTENAKLLGQYFRMYQPSLATIKRILDKKLLAAVASKIGLAVMPTWSPTSIEALEALSDTLPYPVLIKPRTHVHRIRNDKGVVARSGKELIDQYRGFVNRERKQSGHDAIPATENMPIIQPFLGVDDRGVLSVTGFIDRRGKHFVARHSIKVLQRSRPVGVGVCYESQPGIFELSQSVQALCRELDYFGIFEIEFIWFRGSWSLIDFNPRLFNQVVMDIRRGMPLPVLACLDALDEEAALTLAISKVQEHDDRTKIVCYDRFTLRAILLAFALTGGMSRTERLRWRSWMNQNIRSDLAADRGDPLPGIVHAISELSLGLQSIPRFLRST